MFTQLTLVADAVQAPDIQTVLDAAVDRLGVVANAEEPLEVGITGPAGSRTDVLGAGFSRRALSVLLAMEP